MRGPATEKRFGFIPHSVLNYLLEEDRVNNIFSIVTKQRTLELEAPTEKCKVCWQGVFEELLKFVQAH